MAFTFLSRFRVKADHESEFVDLIPQMEANAAAEPATLAYKFYRLDEPLMFGVFESFVDADADHAHQANPASAPIIARMINCIDGNYVREMLNDVTA